MADHESDSGVVFHFVLVRKGNIFFISASHNICHGRLKLSHNILKWGLSIVAMTILTTNTPGDVSVCLCM